MFDLALNHVCYVDRAMNGYALSFGAFVILGTLLFLYFFAKEKKNYYYHYLTVASAVLIFEMFTSPMWDNPHFGKFAYVYNDVSWVLTLGWATLILYVVVLVDTLFKRYSAPVRFFFYAIGMAIFGFLAETLVLYLGLRKYSEEVSATLSGIHIWNTPIEALYYIPVFTALIIGFYKYWATIFNNEAVLPEKNVRWGRSLLLTFIAVILFELMVEPMANNINLPEWSYIYRDISILMTGGWVLIIWLSTKLVDKFLPRWNLKRRFLAYILFGGAISIIIESLYVANGFREYSASAVRDFVGLYTPFTHLPIEIFFAMPMYFALMVGFLRYWELILSKGYISKKQ